MSVATQRDIGSLLKGDFGLIGNTVTAGTGADGAEQDGGFRNRVGQLSAKFLVSYSATLAQDETLSIGIQLQDATDSAGTDAADFGETMASTVVATGGTGGSTETGAVGFDVDLSAAKAYIQAQVTPTLSASGTDTAAIAGVWVFGGSSEVPNV